MRASDDEDVHEPEPSTGGGWFSRFALLILLLQAAAVAGFAIWLQVNDDRAPLRFAAEAVQKMLPGVFWVRNADVRWHVEGGSNEESRLVWGYTHAHSVVPGKTVSLALSAAPRTELLQGRVEVRRGTSTRPFEQDALWQSDKVEISHHPLAATAASLGPNWPVALQIPVAGDWPSGYYSIDVVIDSPAGLAGRQSEVAFFIVTNPQSNGDVLVKLSTNTWAAYTQFGGHDLHRSDFGIEQGGHMVSFDRPTRADFWRWAVWYVAWLEEMADKHGFRIDYIGDWDLHQQPLLAKKYPLLVSLGHDEYWSLNEFQAIHDRVHRSGRNTLFLGANTAHWQARYADINATTDNQGRQLVCYKSLSDPIVDRPGADSRLHPTARFRDDARLPETMLVGLAADGRLDTDSAGLNAYDAHSPRFSEHEKNWFAAVNKTQYLPLFAQTERHSLFSGTGWKKGDAIGTLLGYEWDNRDPQLHGNGHARLWDARKSLIPRIPASRLRVLFSGTARDVAGKESVAESVLFRSKAGAKVFSAGNVRWAWSASKPGFTSPALQRFNENLLLNFLDKPALN